VVRAAYTKETDLFAQHGIKYLNPLLDLSKPELLARQMYATWDPILGLSRAENLRAVHAGYDALERFEKDIRRKAREVIDRLEQEGGVGIVLLGRPYHHDPGINQGIPEELQKRGYPVFSQTTLPLDQDLLERLFGEEIREGIIEDPLDVSDVWKHTFSTNSALKLWAAKFTARHPNLIAVELSNFKCGHDAPIYSTIERIIENSGTPYFAFKDIDENKPTGSIKLRVETIDYFLKLYRKDLQKKHIDD
jgi:predicted nucleotide-binding protein (sugar kinase/HSP70/actin superfamily)